MKDRLSRADRPAVDGGLADGDEVSEAVLRAASRGLCEGPLFGALEQDSIVEVLSRLMQVEGCDLGCLVIDGVLRLPKELLACREMLAVEFLSFP